MKQNPKVFYREYEIRWPELFRERVWSSSKKIKIEKKSMIKGK